MALPPMRVAAGNALPPLVNTTGPVGVGSPLGPLTTTVTVNACVDVMLDGEGVTVTVGVAVAGDMITEFDPVALL